MAAKPNGPVSPTLGAVPQIGSAGAARWVLQRVTSLVQSVQSLINQSVGARDAPPQNPQDGWLFLSRAPWRPVAGQTTDEWVYYDAAGGVWRLLSTSPTNT